jgi:hypothetical protein
MSDSIVAVDDSILSDTSNNKLSSHPTLINGRHLAQLVTRETDLVSNVDPLKLPHNKHHHSDTFRQHTHKYDSVATASTGNGQLKTKTKRSRHISPPSSNVATQLNVDAHCLVLWSLMVICCTLMYSMLDPRIRAVCEQFRSFWIEASDWLVITSLVFSASFLLAWFLTTRSRFFRLQWSFVTASVIMLVLASTHALWAVSAFFQVSCRQAMTASKQSLRNQTGETLLNDLNELIDANHPEHLPVFEEDESLVPVTPTPVKQALAIGKVMQNDELDWLEALVRSYDLKLCGVLHWAIALLLVAITLRLLAKRRRFAINCLKRRGLLIQYYWATLD